ncbi:MAG: endolytic transglycosylase MltG, partial [Gammaproteobacteria bacterium]
MRWLLMAALFGVVLGTAWLVSEYRTFQRTPLAIPAQGLLYGVSPGTSLQGLAADLHSRGILQRPKFLIWMGRIQRLSEKLRAGEYRLTKGVTPPELLQLLVSGKVVQHSLTIVEGWTFQRLLEAVDAHEALVHTLQDLDDRRIMAQLGYPGRHPEGHFFPETYHFPRGMSDLEFLRRAYDTMERTLATAWAARAPELPLKTAYEALILASIVERETGLAEERAKIAGVFIRRLKKGMLLQTDPTVIYGLGKDFDGNIR